MDKSKKREVTLLQYILGINAAQVGTSILRLPADLAQVASTDGWISIFVGWIISLIVSLCMVGVMAKYPGATIYDMLTRYLGKWLGRTWIIIWMASALFTAVIICYRVVGIIKVFILSDTSHFLLALIFLIPVYMVLQGGIRILARYSEFIFFFTLWLPILLLIPLKDAKWIYILPVLKEGWLPILHAVPLTLTSFIGFEMAWILYPYLKSKQSAAKGIIIANGITLLVYLQITLSCFLYFSPDEIPEFLWPTLALVKPIQFPFLERFEIVFLSFYTLIFSAVILPFLFIVTENINYLFNKQNWQLPAYILPLLLLFSFLIYRPDYNQVQVMSKWWSREAYIVSYAFPVLFFLYVTLYTRWKKKASF
ncbi:GerAB/ArcD/ProY family transporter [Aneurinibacillus migulanus]|uniref:Spore germination protein (Amino acid permease) n=1 Tax=Aneurinibacillus migulanus TaxID=47500 RepID=A0A0D1V856_ANEMI|nr:endospore germination permease [Aneurinibacillus migulanus]KIV55539.1 spore gernimation protein [Aneurinibacillus migulanus]KON95842.1 spore gernimation protein [Aneurinibacillus migulanus]MED0891925.1 endospore germination permease [Aneurinibacillus migulanus]MED1617335.1 endospore germination permease [Aneurinibacillus migulanus]SDI39488.1 spore germination protein (amino acid permease) [Aneurinibacillus migulanus]